VTTSLASERLTDEALLRGFDRASLRPGEFRHVDHVRVAWLYLRRFEPAEALRRYVEGIRRLSKALGAPEKYHETITWAYLLLIGERLRDGESWSEFAARNADLLDWETSILDRYYSPELLASDAARRRFFLPDRGL
jgi:hypothetical protein